MISIQSRIAKWIIRASRTKQVFQVDPPAIERIQKRDAPQPKPKWVQGCEVERTEANGRFVHTIIPESVTSPRTFMFLHGGAYISNMVTPHWQLVAMLSRQTGMKAIVPDYPFAPEHTYEAAYAMLQTVYDQHFAANPNSELILVGDSAGAGLAIGFTLRQLALGNPLPHSVLALNPWVDITMTNPSIAEIEPRDPLLAAAGLRICGQWFAGDADPKQYELSPVYGDFHGFPPLHMWLGTDDILTPDSQRLAKKAEAAGVDVTVYLYQDMFHAWVLMPSPEGQQTHNELREALTRSS